MKTQKETVSREHAIFLLAQHAHILGWFQFTNKELEGF